MHNHWNPTPCPPPRRPEDGDPIVGKIIDGRTYPYGCVTTAAYTADKAELDNTISEIDTNVSNLSSTIANKVDKESGKGLSTNDYTTEEKNKLSGIEAQANKTVVDSDLSSSSTNPVENKAVTVALGNKADKTELPKIMISNSEPAATNVLWFKPYNVTPEYEALLYANSNPESSEIVMNTGNTDYGVDNATTSEDIPEGVYNFTIL